MMKKRLSLTAISFALALSGCAELKTAWKEVVDKSVDTAVTTVSQKLSQTTSKNSEIVDFTDFIKCNVLDLGSKSGCHSENKDEQSIIDILSPEQRAAIVKEESEWEEYKDSDECRGCGSTKIELKNASAFGYPIKSFGFFVGAEHGRSYVNFTSYEDLAEISKLFSLKDYNKDKTGYNDILVLDDYEYIDEKKTITHCNQ